MILLTSVFFSSKASATQMPQILNHSQHLKEYSHNVTVDRQSMFLCLQVMQKDNANCSRD